MTADLRAALEAAEVCLVGQHRSVVAEWSGNFGGHVAIREGWVEWDDGGRTTPTFAYCFDINGDFYPGHGYPASPGPETE